MSVFLDVLTGICLVLGCLMSFGAGLGLARFPDVLARLHPGSKPQVFGLLMLLTGVGISSRSWALVPVLALIWVVQLLAAPVAAHMVGRSGFRNRHFRAEYLSHNELGELVERISREQEQEERTGGVESGR